MHTSMTVGKLTPHQRNEAAELYRSSGMSVPDVCEHFGIKRNADKEMGRLLRSLGVAAKPVGRGRTYSLREDAFETITNESAYWIGFLMADGCVFYRKGTTLPESINLSLSPCDRPHIQKFLDFLGCDAPIKERNTVDNRQGWGGSCNLSYVNIYSARLTQSLIDVGVTPRKSLTAEAPLCLESHPDFWRGLLDGDGSMFFDHKDRKSNGFVLGMCSGSLTLVNQFVRFCSKHTAFRAAPRHAKTAIYFRIQGCPAQDIARVLYQREGPYLERKQEIANQAMKLNIKRKQWSDLIQP